MALDHVIRAHGVLAVLVALIFRPLRQWNDTRNMHAVGLTDHLLRDIGLDPPSDYDRATQDLIVTAMVLRGGR